jgi:hypothetical protein
MPSLHKELLRLGIGHLGDLVPRRIGTSRIFGPWIEAGTVNSDYYPYVDLNAARSRFMRSDAVGLIAPRGDNIPVMELLDHRTWDSPLAPTPARGAGSLRHDLALQGEEIVQYMLKGAPAASFRWMNSLQGSMMHTARGILMQCEKFDEGDVMWDEVVNVANRVVASMSSARQKPLWDAVQKSPCLARFTEAQRDWIQLFDATGARDAPRMERLGLKLLAADAAQTSRQWTYLVTATAAAQLANGKPAACRETIVTNWKHLDEATRDWPTMEMLLRLSKP